MGEVYRARDTKLKREVAIKILPDEFSRDPDRVSRFQREAEVLASLNHPNIAAIYDLQEANGSRFLVLELVEGETLAERIKRGPIPVDESLNIAKSICEALEAAHEKGIVHRDLKPANVKITPEGKVKVLDFGLAKAFAADAGAVSLSNSPTMSMAATQQGVILGTAAYMSPEQTRGKVVDKRADIWAFGVVLYEMLTGLRMFEGETISDTLAGVLTKEPDWRGVPVKAQRLLKSCLEKDPKRRLQAVADWRLLLEETAPRAERPPSSRLPWALAAALGLISAVSLIFALSNRHPGDPKTTARLSIVLPPGREIASYPAISPDGRTVAYVTQQGSDESQLYLRDLNSFEARAVPGSSGVRIGRLWAKRDLRTVVPRWGEPDSSIYGRRNTADVVARR
jgi:serine/threonine protein kinase